MPRYFLHVRNNRDLTSDPEGAEFDNFAEAEQEAVQSARDLMAECLRAGQPIGLGREMVISDDTGAVLSSVPFASAIPLDE
jgi:hypothetical protein